LKTEDRSAQVDALWRNAWAYDLEDGQFAADIPYWSALVARLRPTRVLELACGTGRITLPIAAAGVAQDPGFRLVALDYSPNLLARAEEKKAAADPQVAAAVTFVEGDMRSFDLDGPFDLIICGFNGLAYLHTIDEQLACLAAVRRHLAPRGRFAIDLVVPHLDFLAEAQAPVPVIRMDVDEAAPEPGISRLRRNYADSYDAASQTITTAYTHEVYLDDGGHQRWADDLAWHMYFPNELELLLRHSSLSAVERHGDYRQAPWGRRSRQYLWVIAATTD
jgi:SAM-dependent methyltransferase